MKNCDKIYNPVDRSNLLCPFLHPIRVSLRVRFRCPHHCHHLLLLLLRFPFFLRFPLSLSPLVSPWFIPARPGVSALFAAITFISALFAAITFTSLAELPLSTHNQ